MRKYFLPLLTLVCACFVAAQTPETLTNETIIRMVQSGVPPAVIIRTIAASDKVSFSFLPGDLEQITRYKVPDDVFKAMAAKSRGNRYPDSLKRLRPRHLREQSKLANGLRHRQQAPQHESSDRSHGDARSDAGQDVESGQNDSSEYQGKGMWDLNLSATGFIPHSSPSDSFGLAEVGGGYFVTRGSLIGAQVSTFFDQYGQDVFLTGGYEYFFKTGSPRFFPYVGASAEKIAHAGGSTNGNFLAQANAGIRYFVAHHVAIELNYSLDWVHISGVGFTDSSVSVISFGFAHTFGGGR